MLPIKYYFFSEYVELLRVLKEVPTTNLKNMSVKLPVFRRLRGYSFDPSLSVQLETALVNQTVFKIKWEELEKGPIGEYIEVIDFDPASKCFYAPVDLSDSLVLAQDGLLPSESNPQFHQQMAYAVAMTTIKNFEQALGRSAFWSPRRDESINTGNFDQFVQRLRIYPHAMREANAYYSPAKKALLFGYFPVSVDSTGDHIPGGMVFTCLSHDIVAHETTHALLDGMHRRFVEDSQPDSLAFHEAFADIVALFQHFTFPEVLRHQIAKTRGDLASQSLLGELAQQFGKAIGHYGALRNAIGEINPATKKWEPLKPDPEDYQKVFEPHARGSILVAAVFDAFLSIYRKRIADLLRIATGGSGVLPIGELHPDLVNRLANEASKAAQHVLGMCIRGLDYCPPVDFSFGDYLRAIITADYNLVPEDEMSYRIAFVEAFRRRGIYPRGIKTLSPDSLLWDEIEIQGQKNLFGKIAEKMRDRIHGLEYLKTRKEIFEETNNIKAALHDFIFSLLSKNESENFEQITGLVFSPERGEKILGKERVKNGRPIFEVHSLRPARRVGPDGNLLNQVIISMTQRTEVSLFNEKTEKNGKKSNADFNPKFWFRGGCTLILDLNDLCLRYSITKPIDDKQRLDRQKNYRFNKTDASLRNTYFNRLDQDGNEPFALLHRSFGVNNEF